MSRVAIVTDSASDFDPARAAARGHHDRAADRDLRQRDASRPGSTCRRDEFWDRLKSPGAPFPTTAACSPATFQTAYQKAFDAGAEAIVSVHVAGTLSGTIKAPRSRGHAHGPRHPRRRLDVGVDGRGDARASSASRWRPMGASAAEIAATLERRRDDLQVYLALETLEYLKQRRPDQRRAGRDRHAALGQADHRDQGRQGRDGRAGPDPRQGARAARSSCSPSGRSSACRSCTRPSPDVEEFGDELIAAVPGGIDRSKVTIDLVGPSVGPHLGPGCVGAAILYERRLRDPA